MNLIFKIRDRAWPWSSSSTTCGSSSASATGCCAWCAATLLVEGTPGEVQSDHRVIEAYSVATTRRRRGVTAMLEVRDLEVSYGKIKAVKGISFDVEEGEVVTLIGTNGAGKTTTLRTISGLLRPAAGSITFQGKDITTVAAHDIVQLGLAQSPEGRRIFPRLTVQENLAWVPSPARTRASTRTSTRRSRCSRSSRSAAPSWPARSPVASSRCWPWAGR